MAITSKFLKGIEAEARPIIERQMNDAKIIAGLRDVVAAAGGDWGALKALIKARVEDDNDESGEGKRVRKIREKADCIVAYDDMLGSNMNEKNFSASQSYAEAKGRDNAGSSSGRTAEFDSANAGSNPALATTGELTDTQEQPETRADNGANIVTRHLNIQVTNSQNAGNCPAKSGQLGMSSAENDSEEISAPLSPSAAISADTVAEPQAPQAATVPHSNPREPISSPAADSPASISSPEPGSLSEKKDCLKLRNGHCKISFETSALCSECNRAKAEKARAA